MPAFDIAEARTWIGVPFQHLGRTRRGIDCIGLPVVLATSAGYAVRDRLSYGRNVTGELLVELNSQCNRIPVANRQPGDLLVLRAPIKPRHIAIFTGDGIIHASLLERKVVEHRMNERLVAMIHSCWRLKD